MKFIGTVIKGVQIGAKFGVATANLEFEKVPALKEGVYLVDTEINRKKFNGLLHFGELKTFGGKFSAELHLLNFNEDIYDKKITLETLKYVRPVQEFPNADALFTQIETDIVQAEKFFIRREIKQTWQNQSKTERVRMSQDACTKIAVDQDFIKAKTIFAYAPDHQEIPFIEHLMTQFTEKTWCFPKVVAAEKMSFFPVNKFSELQPGYLGLLEPPVRTLEFELKPNLILVPAVAATPEGQRLGRGGGFYDRFLKHNWAKTICILPNFAIKPVLPVEKHDQSVDKIMNT